MTKSYRLRTEVGADKNIRININQDFDFLEILSLKLRQGDVYTRFCADYGVVAGRVIVNGGYGIPNATVSVFIPLDQIDENDPVISSLYPYKTPADKNEDGYRYNLLPYKKTYGGHTPTGTFPDKEDVLTRIEVLEVYEKYYKYTTKTNDSGDFMIVGVPLGIQTIVMDLDLSDMGCFSLRPKDLVRVGIGTPEQFDGENFKSSEDLSSLPQIVNFVRNIDVTPFWGEEDLCNIGITRTDFDLRDLGIEIKPQAVFMGSIFSTSNEDFLRSNCKPKKDLGKLCTLETGAGKILSIRQTIDYDINGQPILEQFNLPNGGKVIDDDGTWLVELPMNIDYVTTNEFGEQVISNDPSLGIPTKGRYRFRVQYQNEDLENNTIERADYLVPNIREYGWTDSGKYEDVDTSLQLKSYAFSLDWNEYADPQAAINCEDYFYEFNFNKVYTVSNLIDRFKWGYNRNRHLGIKEIDSKECNQVNKLPVNDGVRNFDLIFFLMMFLITIVSLLVPTILTILHVLALLYPIIRILINFIISIVNVIYDSLCAISGVSIAGWKPFKSWSKYCTKPPITPLSEENPFKRISLPMMSYPDCEACPCTEVDLDAGQSATEQSLIQISNSNVSPLANTNSVISYTNFEVGDDQNVNNGLRQAIAGYQFVSGAEAIDYVDLDPKLSKLPIAEVPRQGGGFKYLGHDVTLSQSLNMANIRERYFENVNIIKTTVKNTNPTTNLVEVSDPLYDSVMVILCDKGTLNNLPVGSLLSFHDLSKINDPNLTGGTVNQFNNKRITGTTSYDFQNLVTKQVKYVNTGGTEVTANVKFLLTKNGDEYKFVAGNEYFQVITGDTVLNYTGSTNLGSPDSLLNKYLFNKTQRFCYYEATTPNGQQCKTVTPLKEYNDYGDLEIIFLVRGIDPYTQTQNINYDLSKLFGYNFGAGPQIEGQYYMNIPIQKNTDTVSTNATWRTDYKTPESQEVINNNNQNLYHKSYSFTPDQTKFTAFTNNIVKYYNSTDKSRANAKAYSNDSATLSSFTSPAGVYSDIACNGGELGKSTIGFQYGQAVVTAPTNDPYYLWLGGTQGWDFANNNAANGVLASYTPGSCFGASLADCSNGNVGACENSASFVPYYKATPNLQVGDIIYTDSLLTTPYVGVASLYSGYKWVPMSYQGLDQNGNVQWTYFVAVQIDNNGEVLDYQVCSGSWVGQQTISTCTTTPQGKIEGGTFLAGESIQTTSMNNSPLLRIDRVFSPAYHVDFTSNVTISNYQRLILRSDRLPTSDTTEVSGNTSFSLHLNDYFSMYKVGPDGGTTEIPSIELEATDNTNNAQDLSGDTANAYTDAILNTLTCEGMVPITCYSGSGNNFGVETPCTDPIDNNLGQSTDSRVDGGCYFFVDKPLIISIPNDIRYFREWRARFRVTYAACRGVFSQVFQNNWLNGSLYMFSFKKQTIYNVSGQPKKYKFCGTVDSVFREGQGTMFYTEGTTNSLFYRSSPYNGTNGYFVGQIPEYSPLGFGGYFNVPYGANNDRNLFFPTTIMDLGPRDLYTKEICSNPNFEGYLMKNLQSTSYNDQGDILQLAIISRFVNKSYWLQVLGLGDKSVNRFFSRSGDRLDGDITQMFSINSEFGIVPFGDEEYDDNDLYIQGGNFDSVMGIFFSSDTVSRNILTPGVQTFSLTPPLLNYFGYSKTQEVPMYRWKSNSTAGQQTIFGVDTNEWDTDVSGSKFYSQKYQSMSFQYAPTSDYFNVTPTGQKGFIFNSDTNGNNDSAWTGTINTPDSFIVGAPFHFYFGLNKGKTALNKFITNYIG